MKNHSSTKKIAYIGPGGAGFGFQLSGITVHECTMPNKALQLIRQLKGEGAFGIIFVDEGLAEPHREVIAKLNEDPLPAIILLPNPAEPKNVAAAHLQQLMVRAVGSDIFK